MESKRRSFLKVISWRITATLTTMLISFFITGNIDMALKIGLFELTAKILLQYAHGQKLNMAAMRLGSTKYEH